MSATCFEYTHLPTILLTPMHVKRTIYNCLPEDEPPGSKHVEDIKY